MKERWSRDFRLLLFFLLSFSFGLQVAHVAMVSFGLGDQCELLRRSKVIIAFPSWWTIKEEKRKKKGKQGKKKRCLFRDEAHSELQDLACLEKG